MTKGIGNLYQIHKFLNRDFVKEEIDIQKYEEFEILHNLLDNDNSHLKYYDEICQFLSDNPDTKEPNTSNFSSIFAKNETPRIDTSFSGFTGFTGFSGKTEKITEKTDKITDKTEKTDKIIDKIDKPVDKISDKADTDKKPIVQEYKKIIKEPEIEYSKPREPIKLENHSRPSFGASAIDSFMADKKTAVNNIVYGSTGGTEGNEEKLSLLESINSLKEEMNKLGVKTDNIPDVNTSTSVYDMRNVYKMLLHKKNISIHFETSRDLILVGVNYLVNFCDGTGHRPNLTGWNRTAQFKLNNLKTELSQLASGFFQRYEIGPLGQILLALVPSALMHATTRSQQTDLKSNNDTALQNLHTLL